MKKFSIAILLFTTMAMADESLTVATFGLTYHGQRPEENAVRRMTRKVDASGMWAQHVELNLIYRNDDMMYSSMIMKDCFDSTAYALAAGKNFVRGANYDIGFLMGIYVRPNNGVLTTGKEFRRGNFDYLPMPMLTYSHRIPITEKFSFETNLGINFFLNHMNFGFNYKF